MGLRDGDDLYPYLLTLGSTAILSQDNYLVV